MNAPPSHRLPWRECAFVSITAAADIVGRTRGWVDRQIVAGRLEARCLPTGGPVVITTASLARMIDRARPIMDYAPAPERTKLRLIVCNDV